MKKQLYSLFLFSPFFVNAQNVGIGTSNPLQKLEVNGAIKIGTTTNNTAGSIRYNTGKFEGGDGSIWKSLEGVPSKSIIIAQEPDTSALKAAGFSVLRQLDIWDTSFITIPTNFQGSWLQGFPLSTGTNPTAGSTSNETVIYNNNFIYYGSDSYLHAYNITTQQWSTLPSICPLGTRFSCGVTLVGNEVYVTGGYRFVTSAFVIFNTAAKYNLTTQVWTTIANMPVPNMYHMTVAIGTDMYLLNGASTITSNVFNFAKKMYRYNTLTNTWSGDISTTSTPEYLYPGQGVVRNGKIIYVGGNIYSNSLAVIDYNPVTHVIGYLTPGLGAPTQELKGFVATINADKLYVVGSITDTGNVNYNPLISPQTYSDVLTVHYVVDLNTGISTKLSTCNLQQASIKAYKYNPLNDRHYAISTIDNYFIFNSSGSQACNTILNRKGYWSYMKKN
jgi:hypothetical protein